MENRLREIDSIIIRGISDDGPFVMEWSDVTNAKIDLMREDVLISSPDFSQIRAEGMLEHTRLDFDSREFTYKLTPDIDALI